MVREVPKENWPITKVLRTESLGVVHAAQESYKSLVIWQVQADGKAVFKRQIGFSVRGFHCATAVAVILGRIEQKSDVGTVLREGEASLE